MSLVGGTLNCLALIPVMMAKLLRVNGDGLKEGDKLD
jgi:hypothetical protein